LGPIDSQTATDGEGEAVTTQVNPQLSLAEQLFYDLAWRPLIMSGETALFTAVPFLATPGLMQVEEEVIDQISQWVFSQLRLLIDVTAIRLVNSEHQSAYDDAFVKLKILAQESGTDSQEFKDAKTKAADDLARFVRYNR
jgi:hypothetical protein